ncbi:MAG: hypothetical protein V4696_02100 [Pseudomonadota bacterium]
MARWRRLAASEDQWGAHPAGSSGSADIAKELGLVLEARSRRAKFLPLQVFSEPAWDMLLQLYAAHVAGRRISIENLCALSAAPASIAMRWLNSLVDLGLAEKTLCGNDPPSLVQLTRTGLDAMDSYFIEQSRSRAMSNIPPVI